MGAKGSAGLKMFWRVAVRLALNSSESSRGFSRGEPAKVRMGS